MTSENYMHPHPVEHNQDNNVDWIIERRESELNEAHNRRRIAGLGSLAFGAGALASFYETYKDVWADKFTQAQEFLKFGLAAGIVTTIGIYAREAYNQRAIQNEEALKQLYKTRTIRQMEEDNNFEHRRILTPSFLRSLGRVSLLAGAVFEYAGFENFTHSNGSLGYAVIDSILGAAAFERGFAAYNRAKKLDAFEQSSFSEDGAN